MLFAVPLNRVRKLFDRALFGGSGRRASRRSPDRFSPQVEGLEQRQLLSIVPGAMPLELDVLTDSLLNDPPAMSAEGLLPAEDTALIEGFKWHDYDGNGLWDKNSEVGLAGWTIYVDLNENGSFDQGEPSDTTGELGQYSIEVPAPGTYTVREVLQADWNATYPTGGPGPAGDMVLYPDQNGTETGSGAVALFNEATGNFWVSVNNALSWQLSSHYEVINNVDVYEDVFDIVELTKLVDHWMFPNTASISRSMVGESNLAMETFSYTDFDLGPILAEGVDITAANVADRLELTYFIPLHAPDGSFLGYEQLLGEIVTEGRSAGTHVVEVGIGDTASDKNFGNRPAPAVISGNVFQDRVRNGVPDAGEEPFAQWMVQLQQVGGDLSLSVITDANGAYSFTVPAGEYVVSELLEGIWVPSVPGNDAQTVVVGPDDHLPVHFGNRLPPATIQGTKTIVSADPNQNASGWTMYLDMNDNDTLDPGEFTSTPTDAQGNYTLDVDFTVLGYSDVDLPVWPLDFVVREDIDTGPDSRWVQTGPAGGEHVVTVSQLGEEITGIDFSNKHFAPGRIEGQRWDDANGDGVKDPGEGYVGGSLIYVDLNHNGQFDDGEPSSVTSPADGSYSIEIDFKAMGLVTTPLQVAGTLTARTADYQGEIDLGTADHGVQVSDIVDVAWEPGGARTNMVVTTVTGTKIIVFAGEGDVLPAQDTAVTASVQYVGDYFNVREDGSNQTYPALFTVSHPIEGDWRNLVDYNTHVPLAGQAWAMAAVDPATGRFVVSGENLLTFNISAGDYYNFFPGWGAYEGPDGLTDALFTADAPNLDRVNRWFTDTNFDVGEASKKLLPDTYGPEARFNHTNTNLGTIADVVKLVFLRPDTVEVGMGLAGGGYFSMQFAHTTADQIGSGQGRVFVASPGTHVVGVGPGQTVTGQDFGGTGGVVNNPPVVVTPIDDVAATENDLPVAVNLSGVFDDADIPPDALTLTVAGNTNAGLVTTALVGTQLTLSFVANQSGSAQITIQAQDLVGATITDTFLVTVDPQNDAPVVATPIDDVIATENDQPLGLDLSGVFDDANIPPDVLTLTVASNTNAGLVTTTLVGTDLTLSFVADQTGTAEITIQAQDLAGATVTDTFLVTVEAAANTAPVVVTPIDDVAATENDPAAVVDLSGVFDDADIGDALSLTVASNTNAGLVTTTLVGTELTLSFVADQSGTAEITIEAMDLAGATITDTFTVTVEAAAEPATVMKSHIFYNNSDWDLSGNNAAIATNKWELLPGGVASFANYTSYEKGINGIMIDVVGLPDGASVGPEDFQFRVGGAGVGTEDPGTWALLAAPAPTITVDPVPVSGTGRDGATPYQDADRIIITWPDGAIKNQWVQVTVLGGTDLGLAGPDVFYFGNQVAETGNGIDA
ncbi:MAG TPA: SdrD B-like domain-containing protein, partial [Thermoguttaceae bacterium]|nr:SdrD B-like domain-containing protein [Thermoguttaceae bacterium]